MPYQRLVCFRGEEWLRLRCPISLLRQLAIAEQKVRIDLQVL